MEKPKNPDFEMRRAIIMICVADPKKISWGQEMRISAKLLTQFPNREAWHALELKWKPNSLTYFLSKRGHDLLTNYFSTDEWTVAIAKRKQLNELDIPKAEVYNLEQTNTETVSSAGTQKPKTLREFLKDNNG